MKTLTTLLGIVAGNAILAFAVATFILPHNMIANGTAGFSLAMHHYFHLPIVPTLAVLNVVMLIVGLIFLGKRLFMAAVTSTFVYPLLLGLFERASWISGATDHLLLSAIFAGVLSGVGVGLVLRTGASTGGFDIPPLILNKKYNISVGATLYCIDTVLLIAQSFYSDTDKFLYGILLAFLCSATINKVLVMGTGRIQLLIMSGHYQEIKESLLEDLDSGATLIHIETGYEQEKDQAVLSVITNRKLNQAKELIQKIDPQAFIIISTATEVRGRGFSMSRNR